MDKIVLSIIFGALPIISFVLQYYFSKKSKTLNKFKKHFTCYYLDLLFIPFGFIWPFVVNIGLSFFFVF